MKLPNPMDLFVIALALCPVFGIAMTFYTSNPLWLIFCMPALIFLS